MLINLKFPPQRLSHYVFTYCQAVSHPVLLRGSLFLFSVKMKGCKEQTEIQKSLETKGQAEFQKTFTPGWIGGILI